MICKKCGGTDIRKLYHKSYLDCPNSQRTDMGNDEEHPHYTCTCGYSWCNRTKDSSTPPLDVKQKSNIMKKRATG